MGKNLLMRFNGKETPTLPFWFMRQAGRYLPEYQELRNQKEDFIDFCLTPSLAVQATLQPIRRFAMDGAILFADILLVPLALGQNVTFVSGNGPKLEAVTKERDLETLLWSPEKLFPVFETLDRLKTELPQETTLIGFAGGPWTVACYMIGGTSRGFHRALRHVQDDTAFLSFLMEEIERATAEYLIKQIEAGAEAVQIFESHAGLLSGPDFERWVSEPTKKIVSAVKEKHPDTPIIGFPRGSGFEDFILFSKQTGVNILSLDQNTDRRASLEKMETTLQGNLDPALLLEGGRAMEAAVEAIKDDWGSRHVFNLGHGILPETPIRNVEKLCALLRA